MSQWMKQNHGVNLQVNGQIWPQSNSWHSEPQLRKAESSQSQMHTWAVQIHRRLGYCWPHSKLRLLSASIWTSISFCTDCWKMCQISGFSHHFAGETVLHFRARGFPYEIDIKAHVGSCIKEWREVLETRDRCKHDAWRHEDTCLLEWKQRETQVWVNCGYPKRGWNRGILQEWPCFKTSEVGENVKEFTQIQANLCL